MQIPFRALTLVTIIAVSTANAAEKRTQMEMEKATRLQVFLDRANFGPGKIDGRDGEFTRKALALYQQSQGRAGEPDLASVDPVFVTYTVTDTDLESVGELPERVPDQAKLKWMPYRSAAEAIAEKFHCDVDFLEELNSGRTAGIKPGDTLTVPNVEPFELASVKQLKPGEGQTAKAVNDTEPDASAEGDGSASSQVSVKVDTKLSMVTVQEGDRLVAAYPVTIGSSETQTPTGDWKVRGVAKFPEFRYDEKMLKEGERGSEFFLLPPGPNNLVGVVWIALNRKGIGLHGTSEPDSIGRSASHGCIRLANWDVVRLAALVKGGVAVSIH